VLENIKPISTSLSEYIEAHIEMQEFLKMKMYELVMSEIRIPKEYFNEYNN
jgi:hypothetical protein